MQLFSIIIEDRHVIKRVANVKIIMINYNVEKIIKHKTILIT